MREINRRPILDVRASRIENLPNGDKIKQYEVQYVVDGPWVWVSELLIPATPLIYDFEREVKGFNQLADLVLDHELQGEPPLLEDIEEVKEEDDLE